MTRPFALQNALFSCGSLNQLGDCFSLSTLLVISEPHQDLENIANLAMMTQYLSFN